MIIALILIGLISGIISGMGIGGGIVMIPALTILLGFNQRMAQNINLIYFIPTAIIAIIIHLKNGNIEKKGIFKIIAFGTVGAIFGAILATKIDPSLLRKIFGYFLLFMGIKEIFTRERAVENGKS